jgi:LPXTG-motif cell wall-anchored protein
MSFIFGTICWANLGEITMRKILAIGAIGLLAVAALALFVRKRNR